MDEFWAPARLAWATERLAMESPLVNNYKKPFILRRLLETFLGGLRLCASSDVPLYVYILQLILFSVIPILIIIFVILEHYDKLTLSWSVYPCGILVFVYALVIQIIAHLLRTQTSKTQEVEHVNLAVDEEFLEFDSPFGPKTWSFLIRQKKAKLNIIIHSIIAGVVGGVSVFYIRPVSTVHINVPWGASLAFTVLGVFTASVGLWPLIGGAPPEPASFHPLPWDLAGLSRPLHMIICIVVHTVASYLPSVTWLFVLDVFFHLVFASCSILWLLGILPPIDAFIFWILEQWLVIALGGSPMSSNIRLIPHAFFGTLFLCMSAAFPSFEGLMVFASCIQYLVSIDSGWILSSLLSPGVKFVTGLTGKYQETLPVAGKPSLRVKTCRRELVLYVSILVAIVGLSLGCQLPNIGWYAANMNATKIKSRNTTVRRPVNATTDANGDLINLPVLFQVSARDAVGSVVIFLALSVLILNELQKVYILGLIRNPLFAHRKIFQKSSLVYMASQLLQFGGPFVSLILLHQNISAKVHLQLQAPFQTFPYFLLTIPLVRAFRQIWQFPQQMLLQLSVFYVLEIVQRETSSSFLDFWGKLSPATRIFCIGLTYLWGTRLVQRICTVVVFVITSLSEKKRQTSLSFFFTGFNLAMIPILFGLLVLSTVISAPLLPLFTLPIFFLGFPRPLRFWSYPVGRSSNSCEDSVYYEQLTPHVIFALHNLVQIGSLGFVEPGEHFLLRYEDRFLWIQILECGFTYVYYSIKGLELQETSCHTAEASRVDAIFSSAFDDDEMKRGKLSCFNQHAFNTLTPVSQINVIGFSDTKNVLTGVIDSPDTLKVINDYFHKALIYLMMDYVVKKSESVNGDNSQRPVSNITTNSKTKESLKNLPKVDKRAEHHFEETIPHAHVEANDQDKVSHSGVSHISHNSHQSQSGRTSRVAWIGDQGISDVPTIPPVESRPLSWDDDEDPLDNSADERSRFSTLHNEERVTIQTKDHKSTNNKSGLPPILYKANNFTSSLEDLDENEDQLNVIPGIMYDESSDNDSNFESIAPLHKVRFTHPKHRNTAPVHVRVISRTDYRTPIYNSPLSAALAPLASWFLELPYDTEVVDDVQDSFPHAWFKFLLSNFGRKYVDLRQQNSANIGKFSGTSSRSGLTNSKSGGDKEELIQKMQYDEDLEESYRIITGTCHLIILGSEFTNPTSSQVYKTFCGEVPWSMALDWLLSKNELHYLVMKAYRIAVKLSLDHTLIGSMTGWAELESCMTDYSQNWFFGPDVKATDTHMSIQPRALMAEFPEAKSWMEAVKLEVPNLFSMGYNPVKGVYTSRLLTLGDAEVSVGRLGCETVRGLWASLVAELLYLTNDDDERYSIQAQPGLLRNLTVQAADPPLGYPIFASPPLRLAVPWLNATLQQLTSAK
ncbi:pecanex-like protein 4 [Palaemon carinicauda]|uniref:pecanex-like protein 4 n=1 Tax=Palaemon carinicauda TaxID=392227 RepID=UPI0035B5C9AD